MAITKIEKITLAMIIVCLLVVAFSVPSMIRLGKKIDDDGLKSIVDEIWHGERK